MIPETLKEVAEHLREKGIISTHSGEDARRDSGVTEYLIVKKITGERRWKIDSPNIGKGHNRSWYDIRIEGFYIDIKVSECKTADNTNAKKAIYFFLTGGNPDSVSDRRDIFFKKMRRHESPNEKRDFYYLVVNKKAPKDIFIATLKTLTHCIPNANNEPFQSIWDKCREPTQRTWKQARQFLLESWAHSVQKAIDGQQNGMPKSYPEFFEKER